MLTVITQYAQVLAAAAQVDPTVGGFRMYLNVPSLSAAVALDVLSPLTTVKPDGAFRLSTTLHQDQDATLRR